jgi:hypothetical protein
VKRVSPSRRRACLGAGRGCYAFGAARRDTRARVIHHLRASPGTNCLGAPGRGRHRPCALNLRAGRVRRSLDLYLLALTLGLYAMIDGAPDSYLRVLQDVTVHVNGLGKDEVREFSPWTANAISMFGHARQLLIASAVLLERRLPGPAFVLQRPLFEDSLRLAEFSGSSEAERIALMASWRRIGLKKVDGLAQKAARDGAVDDAAALRTHVMDELNKIDAALKRRRVTAKDFMNAEKAAVAFGREDDYPAYEMSHQAVHGNDLVHLISRETNDEGVLIIGKPKQQYVDAIAEWAAHSGLHLTRSFHMLTGAVAEDSALARLEARLTALNETNDNEGDAHPTR